jgi:hypothetical protein
VPLSSFSPRLRTGVVLTGSGTAGAYHAGALKAIAEAGIRIDVIAAHGAGVPTALAAAVDGGARITDPAGPWFSPRLAKSYPWRRALRVAFGGLLAAGAILLSPLLLLVAAALFYAAGMLAALVSLTAVSARLIGWYQRSIEWLFSPPILPTIIPRLLVLAVLAMIGVLAVTAWTAARQTRSKRRRAGAFWWRLIGSPVDGTEPAALFTEALWDLVRGASNQPRPSPAEVGRRYVELLADNFGQPGFHELMLGVHDLDGRRDLIGAVLDAPARAGFESREPGPPPREAETVDFTGPQRELLIGFLAGALRVPVATAPALVEFPSDAFWRGECHRISDRPGLAVRLVDELAGVGVEQVILIGAAPTPAVPHSMRAEPVDLRGRIGEAVRSIEAAALADAVLVARGRCPGVFVIRPDHNPIGPFDFSGVYDEASDRQRTLAELMEQGYADAYRHFIELTMLEH